jgi:hypothetical protein
VNVIALPHAAFHELLKNSALTEEAICRVVQARLEEHRATNERRR